MGSIDEMTSSSSSEMSTSEGQGVSVWGGMEEGERRLLRLLLHLLAKRRDFLNIKFDSAGKHGGQACTADRSVFV